LQFILIHLNTNWIEKIAITSFQSYVMKIDCVTGKISFELKEYRNHHFVLIPFHRLKGIAWSLFWIKRI